MRIYSIHCLRVFVFQVVFSALNNNCWWITSQHCPDIPASPWSQTVLANHSPNRSFYCMPFVCPCHHYWHQTEPPWCVYTLLLESIRSKLSYSELVHSTVGSYLVNVLHRTVCRVQYDPVADVMGINTRVTFFLFFFSPVFKECYWV